MRDVMADGGSFSQTKISALGGDTNYMWTTEKVDALINDIHNGIKDIRKLSFSPFKDNDPSLKRDNLPFEYTPEEIEELAKCKASMLYFITKYCKIQTHKGQKVIEDIGGLRDYQYQILNTFDDNNLSILMASRQTGKTVTSALYMLWFLLFQSEKTALCVADNFTTTKELIEKFKISLEGLPFFMKPGIAVINASNVRFDNKSRLVGRTTTKKSGIGLTVNLLYVDEFAHIEESNIDKFYRAIYPTVTEDPDGKIILTSTPNGKNKFWEIWKDAIGGDSDYVPMRVDWWQVKGRGEKWKKKTIANMGSVEDFNQEYGLQFFASDKLLLNSKDLKRLERLKTVYENPTLVLEEDLAHINESLFFHRNYVGKNVGDFKTDPNNYVVSIDTSDGGGGDYAVLNIYKMVALPIKELLKKKEIVKNELDTISLVQVGYLRSNKIDINEFSHMCEHIIYNIFNPENVRIVLELNHKGDIVLNRLKENVNYWPGQLIMSKHTQAATQFKPGLRLGPANKIKFCEKFKYYIMINRVIPNDGFTIDELGTFGMAKGGTYRGQNGNDDLAMTSVNISSLFESSQFWEIAVETFDRQSDEYVKELEEKIFSIHVDNIRSGYDFDSIRKMNKINENDVTKNPSSAEKSVFNIDTIDHLKKIQDKFFKS